MYIFDQGKHFNKDVCKNISKLLLPNCGEMACVEEYLHTFGNSDIAIQAVTAKGHPKRIIIGKQERKKNSFQVISSVKHTKIKT